MQKALEKYGLSQTTLKIIAIISMAIDHTGAVLFPQYFVMRKIGRLAFPIYCFLIVEGYSHTRDVKKYAIRLFSFALISEIPFDLAFHHKFFYLYGNNVFITLLIGLLVIWAVDYMVKINKYYIFLGVIIITAGGLLADKLHTDYGYYGVLFIVVFYLFKNHRPLVIIPMALLTFYHTGVFEGYYTSVQNLCLLSYIPILLYSGKKGSAKGKYFFYAFYPAHLIVLFLLLQTPYFRPPFFHT